MQKVAVFEFGVIIFGAEVFQDYTPMVWCAGLFSVVLFASKFVMIVGFP